MCDFGFAVVKLNNKRNYINTNGKLISNIWFDKVYHYVYDKKHNDIINYVAVIINDSLYYLDINGNFKHVI